MKTSTRFSLLVVAIVASINLGFATQQTIDFETVGNAWTWSTFEVNPTWSIVANPSVAGINTSANVGKLVINSSDQPWAGVQCLNAEFGPFTFTTYNCHLTMMVYKDVISPIGIKFATATGWSKGELKVSNTLINQWELISFDFSSYVNITDDAGKAPIYTAIAIFPDFPSARTAGSTSYLDDLNFNDTTPADTEAPTGFTASAGTVSGTDAVLKLFANDNSGAVVYTITYGTTTLTTSGASGVEKDFTISGLMAATNYNFSVVCKDASGNTAANNPIVVPVTTGAAMATAPTPNKPAANVISIFSDAYTNLAGTNYFPNWGQSTAVSDFSINGDATKKYTNFNFQGINLAADLDASSMNYLHVDVYPTTETAIRLTPIHDPSGEAPTSLGTLVANQWNSFDIALATYTGVDMSKLYQFKFDGGTGGTFYMDNLYFWKIGTGINNVGATPLISCYPNPAVNKLTISAQAKMSEVTVRNLLGQNIKTEVANSTSKVIDLSGLASGNYLLVIKMTDGKLSTQKFSKL